MSEPFPIRFDLVTFDTPSTEVLAAFWSEVMGLVESEREDGDRWIVLSDKQGIRRLGFQRGAHRPGGTHLDLVCSLDNFDAEHVLSEKLPFEVRVIATSSLPDASSLLNRLSYATA
mgnify:CR=1 FL=1